MEMNENLVTEVTENVEQTTEETPRTYTEAEFNEAVNAKVKEVMPSKIARNEAKIRKEYDRKYGPLENVLKAGTGKESVEELTDTFTEFYRGKGVEIPKMENTRDIEVLARADAEDIISDGYEDVVEEVERLSRKGIANMTPREKIMFKTLAEYRQNTERGNELSSIGVTEDVYNSKEFKDFAGKFNANTPIKDIYDIYSKTQPKKEHKIMGSMKQSQVNVPKDYYSQEDIERLTEEDLDNPAVWEAVRRSMTGR